MKRETNNTDNKEDLLAKATINIAFAVEDNNGMMFNHRRVSKDSKVLEKLINMTCKNGGRLLIRPYSAVLFSNERVHSAEYPWEEARTEDIVFLEDINPAEVSGVSEVTLFRWNRKYPSDLKSSFDFSNYELVETVEFAGTSHEKITKETWKRKNKFKD